MHFINQDVKIQLIINLESSSIQKDISQLDLLKSEKFLSDFLLELIKTNSFELESLKILGQILTMEIEGESQLKIKIAIPKRISKNLI